MADIFPAPHLRTLNTVPGSIGRRAAFFDTAGPKRQQASGIQTPALLPSHQEKETSMTRMARICLAALGAALFPSLALAHPGLSHVHGIAAGFTHPFGGLDHLLAMIGVGLWASQLGGRAVWALPLGFMAALMVGGSLGIAGASMPFVELGILGSLVVIGLAVALTWQVRPAAGFALVAAFALFHGYAHGAEMPSDISALGYAVGFLAATALLHATGVEMGLIARKLDHPLLTRGAGAAISAAGLVLILG